MKWFKKERVVVPFDFSDNSLRAVRVGLSLADRKDDVRVVHVLHQMPIGPETYYWGPTNDQQRIVETRAAIAEKLSLADIGDVQIEVLIGDPVTELAGLAEDIDARLVVIPSRGYGGLSQFLLGSVAQGVVRHAKCPVLVLKD